METFKYRGSEMISEASGADFRSAMIHTTACGLALDEPIEMPAGWDVQQRKGRRPATFGPVRLKIFIAKPPSSGKLSPQQQLVSILTVRL